VRLNGVIFDPSWEVRDVSLEDIVLAYLGQSSANDDTAAHDPALVTGAKRSAS